MNLQLQRHFDAFYQQYLNNLTLQGKRPATIDAYDSAVWSITAFFDSPPDNCSEVMDAPPTNVSVK